MKCVSNDTCSDVAVAIVHRGHGTKSDTHTPVCETLVESFNDEDVLINAPYRNDADVDADKVTIR